MYRYLVYAAILVSFLSWGCQQQDKKTADPSRPAVKIGVIGPFSGSNQYLGKDSLAGIKAALDIYGALNSGQGLEIITRDDETIPEKTIAAFHDIVKENVSVILVLSDSDCMLALKDVVPQYNIPVLAVLASHPAITDQRNISQIAIDDSQQAKITALFAMDELLCSRAAVIYDETRAHYKALGESFIKKFNALGGTLHEYPLTTGSELPKSMFQELKHNDIQFIYLATSPVTVAELAGKIEHKNGAPVLMGSDGLLASVRLLRPDLLDDLEGVLFVDYFSTKTEPTAFGKRLIDKLSTGIENSHTVIAGLGIEAVAVALDALNRCGDGADAICVNTMIRQVDNIEGMSGKISVRENGKTERVVLINKIVDHEPEFIVKIY